jgi:hypothetical protein
MDNKFWSLNIYLVMVAGSWVIKATLTFINFIYAKMN